MLAGGDGSRLAVGFRDEFRGPYVGYPDLNGPEALGAQSLAMFADPISCASHTAKVTCNKGDPSTVPSAEPWVLAVVAKPEDMRVPMTVRFSSQLVAELIQPIWAAWQAGEVLTDDSAVAGTHRNGGLA